MQSRSSPVFLRSLSPCDLGYCSSSFALRCPCQSFHSPKEGEDKSRRVGLIHRGCFTPGWLIAAVAHHSSIIAYEASESSIHTERNPRDCHSGHAGTSEQISVSLTLSNAAVPSRFFLLTAISIHVGWAKYFNHFCKSDRLGRGFVNHSSATCLGPRVLWHLCKCQSEEALRVYWSPCYHPLHLNAVGICFSLCTLGINRNRNPWRSCPSRYSAGGSRLRPCQYCKIRFWSIGNFVTMLTTLFDRVNTRTKDGFTDISILCEISFNFTGGFLNKLCWVVFWCAGWHCDASDLHGPLGVNSQMSICPVHWYRFRLLLPLGFKESNYRRWLFTALCSSTLPGEIFSHTAM